MTISDIHLQAENLREQDKHLDALKMYEQVILEYQHKKDYSNLVEALGGRCLTYKHLFLLSNDFSFFCLAQYSALASLEIAQHFNISEKIHRCNFRLGEMQMLVNNYPKAVEYYTQALSNYPKEEAEKGDFQYHLGEAQYLNGNPQNGLTNLILGLEKIRLYRDTTDSFLINVWESGCLMKLSVLTKDKKYIPEAQKIIDSDDRLIIRKRQLEELKSKLK